MKREETKQLLQILNTAYPSTYRNMTDEDKRQTLALYYELFKDTPTELVVYALKNYIKANEYPPTPAGLQKQIDRLQDNTTPAELWTLLDKAISRSAYHYVDEFNKLPKVIQVWLGDPTTLHNLSQQKIEDVQNATRGQFLKSIGAVQDRQKAKDSMPDNVKQLLENLTQKTAMITGGNDENGIIPR